MTLPFPAAALTQHAIALGKTGAGKSSALRVMVEHLLDVDQPVCILDPKGDWYGIKSSANGKSPGYPFVIFGGEHADVAITEHSAAAVAELIATGNRPALIDLGGWMIGERTRFFVSFAAAFFKHSRGLRHLVIDEVHNFAPQGRVLDPDAGKMLHWANRLASEGRGRGITLLAASQRPQKVHKDFVTSCETLVAMRVIHKLDRDAIKDWVDGCADPAVGREVIAALAGMKRGEAFVWSPEIAFGPERVTFPMFKTFDSFKPRAGAVELKGWAAVDLEDVKSKLAGAIAEAEANDPKNLRARIRELEAQLRRPTAAADPADAAELRVLRRKVEDLERDRAALQAHCEVLASAFSDAAITVQGIRDFAMKVPPVPALPRLPKLSTPAPAAAAGRGTPANTAAPAPRSSAVSTRKRMRPGTADTISTGIELGKGERAVLTAIAQSGDVDAATLTVLTGYKRSSRDTYCQRLRAAGLITAGWPVRATDEGIAALGDFEPLPTGSAPAGYWLEKLGSGGEQQILAALIDAHPHGMTRDEIGAATSFKRSSRDTYLQRLGARKLVEKRNGRVFASGMLFG